MINQILFLVLTYLISSIPFGLVIAKVFAKKDIREHGSKNIGATNVTRVLGKKLGFITLLLDGAKGAVMVIIARFGFADSNNLHFFLVFVSLVAVCGHIYPIYLNFKGGKGVATAIAVLLALDFKVGSSVVICWIVFFVLFRISSISSLVSIFSSIIFSYFYNAPNEQIILCFLMFVIIAVRHKENVSRLLCGKEKSFSAENKNQS